MTSGKINQDNFPKDVVLVFLTETDPLAMDTLDAVLKTPRFVEVGERIEKKIRLVETNEGVDFVLEDGEIVGPVNTKVSHVLVCDSNLNTLLFIPFFQNVVETVTLDPKIASIFNPPECF